MPFDLLDRPAGSVPVKQLNKVPNGAFSAQNSYLQTVWDSTSLGVAKECLYKYQLNLVEQWSTKSQSEHLTFGIAAHKAREYYYHAVAQGADHEYALRIAIWATLRETWTRDESGAWLNTLPDSKKRKDLYHLLMFLVWYTEHYKDDPLKTFILANGKPAVELSFKFGTGVRDSTTDEEFFLAGHIDRLVEFEDGLWITDLKSTGSTLTEQYFAQYSPDNQMSLYYYAGRHVFHLPIRGIIVDAFQLLADGINFRRGFIYRTDEQLGEWFNSFIWHVDGVGLAARNSKNDPTYQWPMNDKSCNHFGACMFRNICAMPPHLRPAKLQADYLRKVWDPTVNRGV